MHSSLAALLLYCSRTRSLAKDRNIDQPRNLREVGDGGVTHPR